MRKLMTSTLVTLNSTVTEQGEWSEGYFDAESKENAIKELRQCNLLLLGRVSYEQFAPVWSQIQGDSYFSAVNAIPKVIVSNTLTSASWNAKILRGDAAENIRALKEEPGKPIIKYGVTALDRTLIAHQLIDEFHFTIYPVVAEGTRIFDGIDTTRMKLELIGNKTYASGAIQLRYRPKWL